MCVCACINTPVTTNTAASTLSSFSDNLSFFLLPLHHTQRTHRRTTHTHTTLSLHRRPLHCHHHRSKQPTATTAVASPWPVVASTETQTPFTAVHNQHKPPSQIHKPKRNQYTYLLQAQLKSPFMVNPNFSTG